MRNIKLTIEYDGKRYLGWQRLGDSDKTIQGKIENIIKQMTGEELEIIGSGRTDGGTHARGQVANFKTNSDMSLAEMIAFLNRYLPQDIVVKKAEEAAERFHARYNATGKQYSYYVWHAEIPSAFERGYSYHYPQALDLDRMREACRKLTGKHDFIGFSALKKTKKSTVRTIERISIEEEGSLLHFTFVGDGFLHKMVRIIVGTLLEIGAGTMELEAIDEVFASKVRKNAGETVPAQGLFLDEVYYK
ncbi:tRNA pseudouridine(38-40) synthase TruA [Enterococcus pallens]|uniref:tRNA pseudouridine synthase A n=1 Tax=Enterococcus pallens ATCC BAA-351 TaxID=1158607 RepID=R2SQG9_9ENTE|nr:tRNA pseudouridine(38-40) synthase TruA [Enterococcus pallens]EOH97465.1 tRNA pseudouridine(38-40) synthase [Enterococcus pallens ATCC BAA-351]EOU21116.1 tRNA pseudouridine(38-40) synthase [Enterococcus pallens ATCC BAA-351]OJG80679.1 tRNA pseudouridine(38-40) synthase [Enterococcus pallens]